METPLIGIVSCRSCIDYGNSMACAGGAVMGIDCIIIGHQAYNIKDAQSNLN